MAAGDRRFILHFDWTLFILVLALASIGLISVISASYNPAHKTIDPLVIRQLIWIAAGTAALLIAVLVDYRALQSYAFPFYILVVGLLIGISATMRPASCTSASGMRRSAIRAAVPASCRSLVSVGK